MNIADYIDHTLLKSDATKEDIIKLCKEAEEYKLKGVCINSSYVQLASKLLDKSILVSVVGFPLGANITLVKALESEMAVKNGAREIDMVMNIGFFKSQDYKKVLDDMKEVVKASSPYPVKVIVETCLLNEEEKIKVCHLVLDSGASFIKTSTGFSFKGADIQDIKLFKSIVKDDLKIKASGGIRTKEDAIKMIEAGADRIGASASLKIIS
jgi:deoxyribose-phosphate aldolase